MSRQNTTRAKSSQSKGQRQGQVKRPPQAQGQTEAETPRAAPTKSSGESLAAQEAKRESRMQRQAAVRAASERRRRVSKLRNYAIVAVAAIAVLAAIVAYYVNESGKPGQGVSQQPSPHIQTVDTPHAAYSTDPPTSGPHVPEVPAWGVHPEAVRKELQVHALEDAGVVISYRPDMDKATMDRLAELTRSYDKEVLMAPYDGLSNPIVLTAWARIDRLDSFDEARIKKFISAFKGIDHHKDSGS